MPSPPRRGVGRQCRRRPPGRSTADRRMAATRTISVALSDARMATIRHTMPSPIALRRLAGRDPLVHLVEALEHGLDGPRLADPATPGAAQRPRQGAILQQRVEAGRE